MKPVWRMRKAGVAGRKSFRSEDVLSLTSWGSLQNTHQRSAPVAFTVTSTNTWEDISVINMDTFFHSINVRTFVHEYDMLMSSIFSTWTYFVGMWRFIQAHSKMIVLKENLNQVHLKETSWNLKVLLDWKWKCAERMLLSQMRTCCSSGARSESSSSDTCVGSLCLPQPFHVKRKLAEEGSDPMSSFFLKSLQHSNFCPFNPDEGIHDCQGSGIYIFSCYLTGDYDFIKTAKLIHSVGLCLWNVVSQLKIWLS